MPEHDPIPSIKTPWRSATARAAASEDVTTLIAVPDHTVLRRIGQGSYGEVWLARNVLGVYRAVKIVYRRSFDDDRPFEREFAGMQHFEPVSRSHESQLNILHVGRGSGCFYYVMELADDIGHGATIDENAYAPRTLRSELLFRGRLPVDECVRLGLALTTALGHLHRHGLVHRDIKPSNIVFVNGIPKLADIGLVARAEATMSFVGTEGYLPPEGPGTVQADLFSLGKVLYEISTGRDRQQFPELPTGVTELPDRAALAELNEVLLRACDPDVKQRYESAAEMHADLALLQSGKSVARLRVVERRLKFAARTAVAVTIVASVVAIGWFWQTRQTRRLRDLAVQKSALAAANQRLADAQEQQLIRAHSANGVHGLEAEDPAASLPWFVEALRRVEDRDATKAELHRLRLGTIMRYHPRLLSVTAQTGAVHTLAFSPDGRWFAAGSDDGQVKIMDVETSDIYRSLIHAGAVHSVEFSPDSRKLLTSCEDGLARLWQIETTNEPIQFAHKAAVRHATFSPNGELVLTASFDRTAQVWRADDGTRVGGPKEHSMPVFHATFSPDGRQIATGAGLPNGDGELNLWQQSGNRWVATPFTLIAAATWTAFSPDGKRLASSCGEAYFDLLASRPGLLVDTETCEILRKLEHIDRITHVSFSPDGRRLATAALGYEVIVRDASSGAVLTSPLKHSRWVHKAVFSPDGRWIASASSDGTARVWDASTGVPVTPPLKHLGEVFSVAFDPSGRRLATAGDGGLICLWDIGHGQPTLPSFWYSPGESVGFFSKDDRMAITYATKRSDARWAAQYKSRGNEPVNVWDTRTGREIWTFPVPGGMPFAPPAISAAGDQLAIGSYDGHVQVRDLTTGQLRWSPLALDGLSAVRAFSHDGKRMATTTQHADRKSTEVRIWSSATGEFLTANLTHPDIVGCIEFSPDDARISTACGDGKVRVWDVATGQLIRALSVCQGAVNAVHFSRNGRQLLTADKFEKTARLWDAETGLLVFPPMRHSGIVWDAMFNSSENRILTISFDMSAVQWDARTGERLDPPLHHRRGVTAGSYDGTGRLIATCSVDETVQVWSAETGELLTSPFRQAGATQSAELTRDGRKLLTSSTQGRVQIWDLVVTDWPVIDLQRYAEAISTQRLTPDGQLKSLSAAEILARVTALRAARPHDFEVSADQLQRWHRREKIDSQRSGNDFAAAFHARRTKLPDFELPTP